MELPQKLTSDLKSVQQQMKLEIQAHQIMRIKQVNDPDNGKLMEDLRAVEKRIVTLGERQNQLMRWLRKLLIAIPTNTAAVAKTLGTTINATQSATANASILKKKTSHGLENNEIVSKSIKTEHVSNVIKKDVINHSTTKTSSLSDSTKTETESPTTKTQPVRQSVKTQPMGNGTKIQSVCNATKVQLVSPIIKLQPASHNTKQQSVSQSTKIQPVACNTTLQPVTSSTKLQSINPVTDLQPVNTSTDLQPVNHSTDLQSASQNTKTKTLSLGTKIQPVNHDTKTVCVVPDIKIEPTSVSTKTELDNLRLSEEKIEGKRYVTIATKDKVENVEMESKLNSKKGYECFPTRTGKQQLSNEKCKLETSENCACLREPLTVEKEQFLSAVGLVTRDILKELQNRRVERKRRSTANHNQFVYGSNWDISSKKRKKSNYLTSSGKQLVTKQITKPHNSTSEVNTSCSKHSSSHSVFKAPYPVSNECRVDSADIEAEVNISSQRTVDKVLLPNVDIEDEDEEDDINRLFSLEIVTPGCSSDQLCFVCQKSDAVTLICSCKIHYHHSCGEVVENCVGCGQKLKTNISERRAEKQRLQEMNYQLKNEKEDLETRAAELTINLAMQVERRKKLLCMGEDVKRKIQCIHEFVTVLKNARSPVS